MFSFRYLFQPEVLVFMIPIVAIIMASIIKIYKMRLDAQHGSGSPRDSKLSSDDVRTIQELNRGFEKLTERIEALETILLDRARKG